MREKNGGKTDFAITPHTEWNTIMITKTIRIEERITLSTAETVFVPCLTNSLDLEVEIKIGKR